MTDNIELLKYTQWDASRGVTFPAHLMNNANKTSTGIKKYSAFPVFATWCIYSL